uniref:SMG7 nonsense mediated mRNA decay factor n=1 Tax=Labrus bergylta TaxID=56723 RepID=A0A3Q3EI06_9LABR
MCVVCVCVCVVLLAPVLMLSFLSPAGGIMRSKSITTLQSQAKNRANPNRSEVQANLSLFLEAAALNTQVTELCTVFNVDLPSRVKSSQLGIISNKQQQQQRHRPPQPSSSLLHLPALPPRYRNQTSQAESYYRHAAQLVPSNGQPYNQLAILASSKGDHLTTIFYYCRSIAVKFPFPAASTNLQKALSKALESRDEVKTKWSVSDFIRAFIKFHGHVYLSKSLDKLDALREKLEEQFQRLILQKAFSSQQLVHITVINLFELHHLRDLTAVDSSEQSYSSEQQISWFQLVLLGVMFSRALLNKSRGGEEVMGECPLPAIKVSLDWLRLRPSVFHEAAVDQRQHIWPWLVSILNSFQPKEDDVSCLSVTPLPEEFELQGFLALRPALRSLDFTKGHQGILVDRDADSQPGLIQCRVSEDGLLVFITDIPEQAIEEPQEKEAPVLQESSTSVLSAGKTQSSWPDGSDRPVVTFKENIKPERNGAAGKGELKRDGKRKSELKKAAHEKTPDAVKAQTELRKTPVSEAKKTPGTQTQTTCSSQFIPIHHPGAFPPLPSRPGTHTHTHTHTHSQTRPSVLLFFCCLFLLVCRASAVLSSPSNLVSSEPAFPNSSSAGPRVITTRPTVLSHKSHQPCCLVTCQNTISATLQSQVPTRPGKQLTHFPVLENTWKIREKENQVLSWKVIPTLSYRLDIFTATC